MTQTRADRSADLTSGPMLQKIILFSIPLAASSILQLLFNAADVVVVGRFAGSTALAAVGSNGSLINLLVNLFVGLSLGANVVAARCFGAKDEHGVQDTVHTAVTLGLTSGVLLAVVGFFAARGLLELMSCPEDVIDLSALYLKIYFIGMPMNMLYNFSSALLRAVGDTKRPLYCLAAAGIINVVLNLVFVIGFSMSVAGVALATIISETVSACLVTAMLVREKGALHLDLHKLGFHAGALKQILLIGVPITLSNSAMSIINIIDTKIVMGRLQNGLGLAEEAAAVLNGQYRIAMNMPNMVASFVYPVTMSLIPFAAAALARQDHAGADRIISSAFRIIAILALPAGIGLSVLSTPIMVLVLPAQREDALAAGPHLQVLGIALIFICLMILTNAILQTYGKEKLPIFTVIVGGIVKIIMNYFLVGNPDINIHGAPISTLCCYLVIVVLNLFFVWKYSPQKPRYLEVFAKPVAASLLMGGAAWAVYGLASRVLDGAFLALAQQMFADPDKIQLWSVYLANAACVLLGILAGVIVYGVLVIALRILRAEDVRSIPRGEKLIKLLHLK